MTGNSSSDWETSSVAYLGVPFFPSQIKMLTDRKQELERRLSAMMEENNLLQGTVEELQDRVLILERQSHEKDMQVRRTEMPKGQRGIGEKQKELKERFPKRGY